MPESPDRLARRIANYEVLAAALWFGLGLVQFAAAFRFKFTAIAGLYNMFAAYTRLRASGAIRRRENGVPAAFKPIWPLLLIGAVNLLVGGAIGVVFVLVDIHVRSEILDNAGIFDRQPRSEKA